MCPCDLDWDWDWDWDWGIGGGGRGRGGQGAEASASPPPLALSVEGREQRPLSLPPPWLSLWRGERGRRDGAGDSSGGAEGGRWKGGRGRDLACPVAELSGGGGGRLGGGIEGDAGWVEGLRLRAAVGG